MPQYLIEAHHGKLKYWVRIISNPEDAGLKWQLNGLRNNATEFESEQEAVKIKDRIKYQCALELRIVEKV
jgi:hypothetical protein